MTNAQGKHQVKCSGERTGCERCRASNTQCIYLQSRVGKVPGIRAKRKPSSIQTTEHHALMRLDFSADQQAGPGLEAEDAGFQGQADEIATWTNNWDFGSPENRTVVGLLDDPQTTPVAPQLETEPAPCSSRAAAPLGPEEYDSPGLQSNLEDLLMRNLPDTPAPTPTQKMPLSLGLRPRNEVDSRCCLECCQLISDMETYIMADLRAFKIILEIIRKAIDKAKRLTTIQEDSCNLRCLFLLNTLMYQILELLELGLSIVNLERERHRNESMSGHVSGLGLGFGDTSIDAEEQLAFKVQRLLKEGQRATELTSQIATLAGMGPDAGPPDVSEIVQEKARRGCHLDLFLRLKDFTERLTKDDT